MHVAVELVVKSLTYFFPHDFTVSVLFVMLFFLFLQVIMCFVCKKNVF